MVFHGVQYFFRKFGDHIVTSLRRLGLRVIHNLLGNVFEQVTSVPRTDTQDDQAPRVYVKCNFCVLVKIRKVSHFSISAVISHLRLTSRQGFFILIYTCGPEGRAVFVQVFLCELLLELQLCLSPTRHHCRPKALHD